MKTTRRMRAASLLAVAALGLSACGAVDDLTGGSDNETTSENSDNGDNNDDSNDNSDDDSNDDSDDENTDDDSTDDDDTDGDQGSQSLTAPGTELKVGDTATIPQGKEGDTVKVTVSKITEGSSSDLSHLEDAHKYTDYTPVYIQYEITGTDNSSNMEYRTPDGFRPVLSDGRRAGSLTIIGTQKFDKCDSNSFPKGFGEGDKLMDCDIAMLASGQELGGAEFAPYDGEYSDSGKIVWKQ